MQCLFEEPPVREELAMCGPGGGVLLPVPGGLYGRVLHRGDQRVRGAALPQQRHLPGPGGRLRLRVHVWLQAGGGPPPHGPSLSLYAGPV